MGEVWGKIDEYKDTRNIKNWAARGEKIINEARQRTRCCQNLSELAVNVLKSKLGESATKWERFGAR